MFGIETLCTGRRSEVQIESQQFAMDQELIDARS
jgi:hypothetical protein